MRCGLLPRAGFEAPTCDLLAMASVVWREENQRTREDRTGDPKGSRNACRATPQILAGKSPTSAKLRELLADQRG